MDDARPWVKKNGSVALQLTLNVITNFTASHFNKIWEFFLLTTIMID
jgi:hypothetical protein